MSGSFTNANEKPNPDEDGITHIRLHPEAKTDLGRMLHIGAHRTFEDPEYGRFESIIAFWRWYVSGRSYALRDIHHDNMIRSSTYGTQVVPGTERETVEVLKRSIESNISLKNRIEKNTLPFITYDVVTFNKREGEQRIVYPSETIAWYDNALNKMSGI